MLNQLDARLMEAKGRLRRKRKLQAVLAEARRLHHDAGQQRAQYRRQLESEQADVKKLEGISLTGLFYAVLGSKEDQLEKERQEFLTAKLKHDEAVESLEETHRDVESHQTALSEFDDAETKYDDLIREKERLLSQGGDKRANQLLEFSERLGDLEADRRELQEAIQAGNRALTSLEATQSQLRSASNWGTWDVLGGGVISTAIKHSKIDNARQQAHAAQRDLRHFQEELADAGERLNVSLEIGGFSKFADYFFDGLIADWIVQSKIRDASSACSSIISQVSAAISVCRRRLSEIESDAVNVGQRRREFVEGA